MVISIVQFDILPANMKTVTVRIRERGKYSTASVTLPQDLIKRNNLKNGTDIVLCYLCKADENPKPIEDDIKERT
jgi:hypothetical protein